MLTIRYGLRAADLLDKLVAPSDYDNVQVGALIVAAICGHPRETQPGNPTAFVWTDHIALASGISLRTAFAVSDVQTPQRHWLKSMEGKIRLMDIGGPRAAPADESDGRSHD